MGDQSDPLHAVGDTKLAGSRLQLFDGLVVAVADDAEPDVVVALVDRLDDVADPRIRPIEPTYVTTRSASSSARRPSAPRRAPSTNASTSTPIPITNASERSTPYSSSVTWRMPSVRQTTAVVRTRSAPNSAAYSDFSSIVRRLFRSSSRSTR
ncbi:hypothetical protein ACFQL4_11550 [Halosimplex aquaticum]